MYNKYIGNTGKYYHVDDKTAHPVEKEQAAVHPAAGKIQPPSSLFGLGNILGGILPSNFDSGDILLLLILMFLYMESGDEEFLIILVIVGYNLIKEK